MEKTTLQLVKQCVLFCAVSLVVTFAGLMASGTLAYLIPDSVLHPFYDLYMTCRFPFAESISASMLIGHFLAGFVVRPSRPVAVSAAGGLLVSLTSAYVFRDFDADIQLYLVLISPLLAILSGTRGASMAQRRQPHQPIWLAFACVTLFCSIAYWQLLFDRLPRCLQSYLIR